MVGRATRFSLWSVVREPPSARTFVQGKPAVRRGRKARDLHAKTARLPKVMDRQRRLDKESHVKANLARFTWAVAMLAAMALSVGAWMRW